MNDICIISQIIHYFKYILELGVKKDNFISSQNIFRKNISFYATQLF